MIEKYLEVQLVLSTGSCVTGFTLDPSLGEFILTHPHIKPSRYVFFSFFGHITNGKHNAIYHIFISYLFYNIDMIISTNFFIIFIIFYF
jgi:fructose-1,6-bisphosphatase